MLWAVPVLVLIAVYCWFRWSHRDLLSTAAKLPYVFPAFPLVGHSYFSFWGRIEMTRSVLEMTRQCLAKGLKTVVFWCGPLPIIAVHDVEDIQTILNSSNTTDKGDEYDFFVTGLDSGVGEFKYNILSAPGQTWRVTRKHLNPLFHPRNLQHMVPVFNQNSRELVAYLSEHVGHGSVNLMPCTMDTALKTVCNLLFGPGVQIDVKSQEFRGLMTFVETIPEIFICRILRPWLRFEPLFRFLYRKELNKLDVIWKNFTDTPLQMAKTKSELKQMNSTSDDIRVNGLPDLEDKEQDDGPLNIVDAYRVLQKNHPEFTEADLRCEMLAFYCTGTDTVGSGVASCLLALAQYQDIQERLYQEVYSTVGPDDDVTLEDLNRMPYLDQVLKETLRWFVLVPYILRRVGKDIKLSSCTVPAGNTIIVCLAGIHLDPKLYEDPYQFDPERFSHERTLNNDRFSFIPFSGGPRNCIAKTYAMQLMKIMVVHVLRRFKLSTDMDIYKLRKRLVVTLVSADGYNVSLQERH